MDKPKIIFNDALLQEIADAFFRIQVGHISFNDDLYDWFDSVNDSSPSLLIKEIDQYFGTNLSNQKKLNLNPFTLNTIKKHIQKTK
jgi:hypothetical protein